MLDLTTLLNNLQTQQIVYDSSIVEIEQLVNDWLYGECINDQTIQEMQYLVTNLQDYFNYTGDIYRGLIIPKGEPVLESTGLVCTSQYLNSALKFTEAEFCEEMDRYLIIGYTQSGFNLKAFVDYLLTNTQANEIEFEYLYSYSEDEAEVVTVLENYIVLQLDDSIDYNYLTHIANKFIREQRLIGGIYNVRNSYS